MEPGTTRLHHDRRYISPIPVGPHDLNGWRDKAACAWHPQPDLWFPVSYNSDEARKAVQVCRECPVAAECAEYALTERLADGIFGGMLPHARKQMLRRRARGSGVKTR